MKLHPNRCDTCRRYTNDGYSDGFCGYHGAIKDIMIQSVKEWIKEHGCGVWKPR